MKTRLVIVAYSICIGSFVIRAAAADVPADVDFNRDIRPLLARNLGCDIGEMLKCLYL